MKYRYGFVSNSSSCSFCIYGLNLDTNIVVNFLKSKGIEIDDDENLDDVCEKMNEYLYIHGKEYHLNGNLISATIHYPDYYEGINIGRDLTEIHDDETGLQFKESVRAVCLAIDESSNPRLMTEAWHD